MFYKQSCTYQSQGRQHNEQPFSAPQIRGLADGRAKSGNRDDYYLNQPCGLKRSSQCSADVTAERPSDDNIKPTSQVD